MSLNLFHVNHQGFDVVEIELLLYLIYILLLFQNTVQTAKLLDYPIVSNGQTALTFFLHKLAVAVCQLCTANHYQTLVACPKICEKNINGKINQALAICRRLPCCGGEYAEVSS